MVRRRGQHRLVVTPTQIGGDQWEWVLKILGKIMGTYKVHSSVKPSVLAND